MSSTPTPASPPTRPVADDQATINREIEALRLADTPGRRHPDRGYRALPQQRAAPPEAAAARGRRPRGGRAHRARSSASPTSPPSTPTSPRSTRGEPLGERITVTGRVLDGAGGRCAVSWSRSGRPTPPAATSTSATSTPPRSTRTSPAPAAPSPTTTASTASPRSSRGRTRGGTTVNAWRPAHIHFSLFGTAFTQRLITQMYFPGDPLFALDPIYQSITDPAARDRLVATYDHDVTEPEWSARLPLGHRARRAAADLDGGRGGAPDAATRPVARLGAASSPDAVQTVGPFFGYALPFPGGARRRPGRHPGAIRCTAPCYDGAGDPSRTRSSSSGRPTPDGSARRGTGSMRADPSPARSSAATAPTSPASAASPPTPTALDAADPAPGGRRAVHLGHASSPAACCTTSTPGSTCRETPTRTLADPLLTVARAARAARRSSRAPNATGSTASTSGCRATSRGDGLP